MTTIATADLYDERGDELDSLSLQLHDIGGHVAFDGPVRTIRCHRDNALVKATLATPGDGAVLVVDGGGSLESALVGDLIAASALEHGWAGIIVFGANAPARRSARCPSPSRRSAATRARAPKTASARSMCPSRSRASPSAPAHTCGPTPTASSSNADHA